MKGYLRIFLFAWLAVRLHLGQLPAGMTWGHLAGIGVLGGIGFAVSILVAGLAFEDPVPVRDATLGLLAASVVAGGLGAAALRLATKQTSANEG